MKRCPMCRITKEDSNFFKRLDGLATYCKPCSAARKRKGKKTKVQLMLETYPEPGMKRCAACSNVKPLEEFGRRTDGRPISKCRGCRYIEFKDWSSRVRRNGVTIKSRGELLTEVRANRNPTATTRVCTKCLLEKPQTEFRKCKGVLAWRCRVCRNEEANAWYAKRKEVARIERAKYRAANLERVRRYARNGFKKRHALKRGAVATLTTAEWETVLDHYGRKCLKCGTTKRLSQDYVIPIALGGTHSADNVQPLCVICNSSKHTKIVDYRPDSSDETRARLAAAIDAVRSRAPKPKPKHSATTKAQMSAIKRAWWARRKRTARVGSPQLALLIE